MSVEEITEDPTMQPLLSDSDDVAEPIPASETSDKKPSALAGKCLESEGWIDVLGNQKLFKKVVSEGTDNTRPVRGKLVTVSYQSKTFPIAEGDSTTSPGSVVESIDDREFCLGEGDVMKALDLCVALMNAKEVCMIRTFRDYAYDSGSLVCDDTSAIEFIITLQNVGNFFSIADLSSVQQIEYVEKKKDRGNDLYQSGDMAGAINSYSKAIKYLEDTCLDDDHSAVRSKLLANLYSNLAAAQLKLNVFDKALESCEDSLLVDPGHIKSLFRKGKALAGLGQFQEAFKFMNDALQLEPSSRIIHNELSALKKILNKETSKEKDVYSKMFPEKLREKTKRDVAFYIRRTYRDNKLLFFSAATALAVALIAILVSAFS